MFRRFLVKATAGALAFSMALTLPMMPVMAQECGTEDGYELQSDVICVDEGKEYATTKYTSACGNYKYTLAEDNTATLVKYLGSDTAVTLPAKVDDYVLKGLAEQAIDTTDIEEITIPANITEIADGAFYYNRSLKKINVDAGNTSFEAVDGVLFDEAKKVLIAYPAASERDAYTVPNGVVRIGKYSFMSADNLDSVVFADTVQAVGDHAFSNSTISNVDMGKGLITIENGAFRNGSWVNLVVPDSVTSIGNNAFRNNSNLKSLTLGKNVKSIGTQCIFECSPLNSITIPASLTDIKDGAIGDCYALKEIIVEEGNENYKSVDGVLFSKDGTALIAYPMGNTALEYVIPDTVTYVGDCAFYGAKKIEKIIVPTSVTELGWGAFRECTKVKNIDLSYNISVIGQTAFCECTALEGIIIPAAIKKIDTFMFSDCNNLKTIFVPSEVTYIDAAAFSSWLKVENVCYVGTEEDWKNMSKSVKALQEAEVYYAGNLKNFVDRMYTVALGRDYDAVGLNVWVRQLIEETHDGAGLAREFVLGEEFALRNLSDEQYVDTLYATFFNREADATGKELWLATLASGASREYVLSNFVNLDEFTLLCADYEINRGVMFADGNVAAPGLPQFVSRLYEEVMGRGADSEGLCNWTVALATKAITAEEAAANFFMSQEYELKNVDSTTFVTDCYSVFMDREADEAGLAFWVACLDEQGVSRQWVISEFAKSAEFKEIAAKYGL